MSADYATSPHGSAASVGSNGRRHRPYHAPARSSSPNLNYTDNSPHGYRHSPHNNSHGNGNGYGHPAARMSSPNLNVNAAIATNNGNANGSSTNGNGSSKLILDAKQMFQAQWNEPNSPNSTFAFALEQIQSDHGTCLLLTRRNVGADQLPQFGLQDVSPGDVLVGIGDEKVYHLGFENSIKYLRCVRKPVCLTFQRSPYGTSQKPATNLASNEYNFNWEQGPLGLVLTADEQLKIPVVKRITARPDSVHGQNIHQCVSVGDQLIYVNDIPTCEYHMSAIMHVIQTLQKPILLRFRKPLVNDQVEIPELSENEYEFLWEYGPLGLVVGMSKNGLPFVRSVTGKGTSKQLDRVQVNDEIVLVNEQSAEKMGFNAIINYLMNVPKPALIRFRRGSSNDSFATPQEYVPSPTPNVVPPLAQSAPPPAPAPMMTAAPQQPPPYHPSASLPVPPKPQPSYQAQQQALHRPASATHVGVSRPDSQVGAARSSYQQNRSASLPKTSARATQDDPFLRRMSSVSSGSSGTSAATVPAAVAGGGGGGSQGNAPEKMLLDPQSFYSIMWSEGPFGYTVREVKTNFGSVLMVTKHTGKEICAGLRRVAVGDLLVRIGEANTYDLGFEKAAMYLRSVPKPVRLEFQAL